ncbi:MAG: hypothetical protein QME05_03780 [Candidatus Margulisbacteria bacterium]|nr:hypothetical protein [Candidatus Margulisiibacteriota bacterium]
MESWQLKFTPQLSGQANMEYDLRLFEQFEEGKIPSTLRIYSWKPKCISLGYAQKIERWIKGEKARGGPWGQGRWDVVKRPTGGGIVFHNEAEVTYSIVTDLNNPILPKGLVPAYKKLSEAVVYALGEIGIKAEIGHKNPHPPTLKIPPSPSGRGGRALRSVGEGSHLCFSFPAEYEIVVGGKKIVGSAQKRGNRTLLQQGSIFVSSTSKAAFSVLKSRQNEINAISVEEILGRKVSFDEMAKALTIGFRESLGHIFRS